MNKIPGWTSELELKILEDLASYVPENGSILEIGSFLGRSTFALYRGKKESVTLDVVDKFKIDAVYSPTSNFLYILGDTKLLSRAKNLASKTNSWRKSFELCLGKDIIQNINVFETSSQDFEVTKKYDLIFIDGDHSKSSVGHDIKKFTSENSLVVGDDFIEMFPGVAVAVASCRTGRSVVILKNTKFYTIIPNLNNNWLEILKKYL